MKLAALFHEVIADDIGRSGNGTAMTPFIGHGVVKVAEEKKLRSDLNHGGVNPNQAREPLANFEVLSTPFLSITTTLHKSSLVLSVYTLLLMLSTLADCTV